MKRNVIGTSMVLNISTYNLFVLFIHYTYKVPIYISIKLSLQTQLRETVSRKLVNINMAATVLQKLKEEGW